MATKLITDFENGAIDPAEFHHAQHLEVALWYLLQYPPAEALIRMRAGLQRLLAMVGRPEAYNEETTVRWMERIEQFLFTADRSQPFEQMCSALITETAAEPPRLTQHG